MADKLKPCPFCGSEAVHIENYGGLGHYGYCRSCEARGPLRTIDPPNSTAYQVAVKDWNTRREAKDE